MFAQKYVIIYETIRDNPLKVKFAVEGQIPGYILISVMNDLNHRAFCPFSLADLVLRFSPISLQLVLNSLQEQHRENDIADVCE